MPQSNTQSAVPYTFKVDSWTKLERDAKSIRKAVFIEEQNIPEQDEWDAQDAISQHFVMYSNLESTHVENKVLENRAPQAIATARLLKNNSIGRVAVLKAYRGQGVGRLIMQKVIEYAKQEHLEYVTLSSQVHAIPFYESLGFVKHGDEYLDCGIPHIDMELKF